MKAMSFNRLHGTWPNEHNGSFAWSSLSVVAAKCDPESSSPEIFYLTEQEADTHGIAFGRDLIGGKLAGLSVTDMKVEKRHEVRRYHVQFPTVVSEHTKQDPSSLMLDLSRSGCQLKSQSTMAPGKTVELQYRCPAWRNH